MIGTLGVYKYSRSCWKASREQTVVRDLTAIAFGGFFAWFWWEGLDHFKRTPCGTYGYWFYKLDLYGPLRIFMKACSLLVLVQGVKIMSNFALTYFKIQARGICTDSFKLRLRNSLEARIASEKISVNAGPTSKVRLQSSHGQLES